MNKNIPIPSDLVLKVSLSDLYGESGDPIALTDIKEVQLDFTSGGKTKTFTIDMEDLATIPDGVSVVTPTGDNAESPYIVVCLCTGDLLPGQLALRSTVSIPDTRFHDDVRHEVSEYMFAINLT